MGEKPECQLSGTNGNIFALTARASSTLKRAGLKEQAKEMTSRVWSAKSYDEALQIIMGYVDAN